MIDTGLASTVLAVVGTAASQASSLAAELSAALAARTHGAAPLTVIAACAPADTDTAELSQWLNALAADGWLFVPESAHNPTPADEALRNALLMLGLAHAVIHSTPGQPASLLSAALAACAGFERAAARAWQADTSSPWRHWCGRCGDAGCERRLFDALPR